jgi:hypothetical protein
MKSFFWDCDCECVLSLSNPFEFGPPTASSRLSLFFLFFKKININNLSLSLADFFFFYLREYNRRVKRSRVSSSNGFLVLLIGQKSKRIYFSGPPILLCYYVSVRRCLPYLLPSPSFLLLYFWQPVSHNIVLFFFG